MGRRDKPLVGDATQMLGARLREARQTAGISLTQQAAALGYSKGYVSAIERGLQWPSHRFVERYSMALTLDPTVWLTVWEGNHPVSLARRRAQAESLGGLHLLLGRAAGADDPHLAHALHQLATEVARIAVRLALNQEPPTPSDNDLDETVQTLQATVGHLGTLVEALLPPATRTPTEATTAPEPSRGR